MRAEMSRRSYKTARSLTPSIPPSLRQRHSISKPFPRRELERLKNRTPQLPKPDLDTSAITSVIDSYIMPMFTSSTHPTEWSGSVYSELKLSTKLSMEKEELFKKQQCLTEEVSFAKQSEFQAQNELSGVQKSLIDAQTALQMLQFQYGFKVHQSQILIPQKRSLDSKKETKTLIKQINKLTSENEELKYRVTDLEHTLDILKMQFEITGEKLKGLYNAFHSLSNLYSLNDKLHSEVGFILNLIIQQSRDYLKQEDLLKTAQLKNKHNDEIVKVLIERNDETEFINKHNSDILKEKVLFLNKKLEETKTENEHLKIELDENKHKNQTLNKELRFVSEKLRKLQSKDSDHKYCKNCLRYYKEKDNYNWSCKVHKSPYSENIYFCCGESSKNAPGCITSKHMPRDEEIEENVEEDVYCSSCRGTGHRANDCPKDPNVRTSYAALEESERICAIQSNKESYLHKSIATDFQNILTNTRQGIKKFSELSEESDKEYAT